MILKERTSYRIPLMCSGLIALALLAVLAVELVAQPALPTAPPLAPPRVGPGGPASGVKSLGTPASTTSESADGVEQRIAQLEARLTQLIELLGRRDVAEVDPLREQAAVAAVEAAAGLRAGGLSVGRDQPGAMPGIGYQSNLEATHLPRVPGGGESVEALTRSRYKLPQETADALAVFIKQFVKTEVEAKAEGEMLTVTASREDQARIAAFLQLLRDATSDKRE